MRFPLAPNVYISQSAIEHFADDLVYFKQLRKAIAERGQPALQIHMSPSVACLRLYRFHRVRQYTPRTASMIARLFRDSSCTLFTLGGAASNELHREYITIPLGMGASDRRFTETERYEADRLSTIRADVAADGADPTFYALVIRTDLSTPIP